MSWVPSASETLRSNQAASGYSKLRTTALIAIHPIKDANPELYPGITEAICIDPLVFGNITLDSVLENELRAAADSSSVLFSSESVPAVQSCFQILISVSYRDAQGEMQSALCTIRIGKNQMFLAFRKEGDDDAKSAKAEPEAKVPEQAQGEALAKLSEPAQGEAQSENPEAQRDAQSDKPVDQGDATSDKPEAQGTAQSGNPKAQWTGNLRGDAPPFEPHQGDATTGEPGDPPSGASKAPAWDDSGAHDDDDDDEGTHLVDVPCEAQVIEILQSDEDSMKTLRNAFPGIDVTIPFSRETELTMAINEDRLQREIDDAQRKICNRDNRERKPRKFKPKAVVVPEALDPSKILEDRPMCLASIECVPPAETENIHVPRDFGSMTEKINKLRTVLKAPFTIYILYARPSNGSEALMKLNSEISEQRNSDPLKKLFIPKRVIIQKGQLYTYDQLPHKFVLDAKNIFMDLNHYMSIQTYAFKLDGDYEMSLQSPHDFSARFINIPSSNGNAYILIMQAIDTAEGDSEVPRYRRGDVIGVSLKPSVDDRRSDWKGRVLEDFPFASIDSTVAIITRPWFLNEEKTMGHFEDFDVVKAVGEIANYFNFVSTKAAVETILSLPEFAVRVRLNNSEKMTKNRFFSMNRFQAFQDLIDKKTIQAITGQNLIDLDEVDLYESIPAERMKKYMDYWESSLTDDQMRVIRYLRKLPQGIGCIQGVPGSGKTETVIRACMPFVAELVQGGINLPPVPPKPEPSRKKSTSGPAATWKNASPPDDLDVEDKNAEIEDMEHSDDENQPEDDLKDHEGGVNVHAEDEQAQPADATTDPVEPAQSPDVDDDTPEMKPRQHHVAFTVPDNGSVDAIALRIYETIPRQLALMGIENVEIHVARVHAVATEKDIVRRDVDQSKVRTTALNSASKPPIYTSPVERPQYEAAERVHNAVESNFKTTFVRDKRVIQEELALGTQMLRVAGVNEPPLGTSQDLEESAKFKTLYRDYQRNASFGENDVIEFGKELAALEKRTLAIMHVVVMTTAAVGEWARMRNIHLDAIFMDEAGRTIESDTLAAFANTFGPDGKPSKVILIGDTAQLPPQVKGSADYNPFYRQLGVSMMARLINAGLPSTRLEVSERCCNEITELSSRFYGGRMTNNSRIDKTPECAAAAESLQKMYSLDKPHNVVLVNVETAGTQVASKGSRYNEDGIKAAVMNLRTFFHNGNHLSEDTDVMQLIPYNVQKTLFKRALVEILEKEFTEDWQYLYVLNVDEAQSLEAFAVFLDLTTLTDSVGFINGGRLNVAATRARLMLIVSSDLKRAETIKRFPETDLGKLVSYLKNAGAYSHKALTADRIKLADHKAYDFILPSRSQLDSSARPSLTMNEIAVEELKGTQSDNVNDDWKLSGEDSKDTTGNAATGGWDSPTGTGNDTTRGWDNTNDWTPTEAGPSGAIGTW